VTPPELQPTQRIELAAVVRNALERLAPILDELEVLVEVVPAIGADVATWSDHIVVCEGTIAQSLRVA
jgi:hypothetical protein